MTPMPVSISQATEARPANETCLTYTHLILGHWLSDSCYHTSITFFSHHFSHHHLASTSHRPAITQGQNNDPQFLTMLFTQVLITLVKGLTAFTGFTMTMS